MRTAAATAATASGDAAYATELERLYHELKRRVTGDDTPDLADAFALAAFELSRLDAGQRSVELDAIELLAEAEAGFRRGGDVERASQAALLRADGLRRRGRLAEARTALDDALRSDVGARGWRPFLLAAAADLARNRQDFEAAQARLAEGEASLLDVSHGYEPHRDARFRLAGVRGETLLDLGLPDQAALWFVEERRLADQLKDGHRLAALFHRLRLDNAREDFGGMIARIERGLRELAPAREQPSIRGQLLVRLGIAQAERDRGRASPADEARATLDDALAQPGVPDVDALSAELMLADIALREGRLDDAEERLDAATRRVQRWDPTDRGEVPVRDAATLAAGRVRLALARDAPARELTAPADALERAWNDLIAAWSATPARSGGVGFLHFGSRRRVLSELIRVTLAVDDGPAGRERAFGHLLRAQEQVTLLRRARAPSVDLAQIRRTLLDDGVGALVYMPALDRSHVFAVDRDRIVHAELPSKDAIEEVGRELVSLLGTYPDEETEAARRARRTRLDDLGRRLAQQLLPPTIRRAIAPWSDVIVVGAGLLGHVPFEWLPLDDEGALGLVRAVCATPSLPLVSYLQRRDGERRIDDDSLEMTLVAAPHVAASVEERWPKAREFPLPDAARSRLTSMFDEERIAVHVGASARAGRLSDGATSRSRVLEILTHGVHDPRRERPSGLVLTGDGDDGILWCEDVERLAAPPVVVLLACGTARGPTRRGDEGVTHLGGAFLAAGARAVVLSRTALDYDAALLLGETFNRELAGGRSPAAALTRARGALAAEPRTSDPFFWAAVQLLGVGR